MRAQFISKDTVKKRRQQYSQKLCIWANARPPQVENSHGDNGLMHDIGWKDWALNHGCFTGCEDQRSRAERQRARGTGQHGEKHQHARPRTFPRGHRDRSGR